MTTERQAVRLSDGRSLSWIEYGEPDGAAVLFTTGTPSSGLGAAAFDGAARAAGLRLLAFDKPGYGGSDRDPRRIMVSYGQDVAEAVHQLGLKQVLVAGQSGGGPHAMSVAAALGDRAKRLLLLCSYGPVTEPGLGRYTNSFMRSTSWQARRAPFLLALTVRALTWSMGDPDRAHAFSRKMAATLPPQEREVLDLEETRLVNVGAADGLRHPYAAADEFFALGRPWGFQVEDVTAPTRLWHGTLDTSCYIGMARELARRLPNGSLRELEGYGHMWFDEHLNEAFTWLSGETPA